jgi:V8-like Glu-specific endopeptidase
VLRPMALATVILFIAFTTMHPSAQVRTSPAPPQAAAQVPSTRGVGLKLDPPDLKGREAIKVSEIKTEVTEKAKQATQAVKPESIASDLPADAAAAATREAVLASIPMGYGTLLKTRNAVDPGPQSDGRDPRVIDLKKQPHNEVLIGQSNFLPVRFLEVGTIMSKAVARVAIQFEDLPNAGIATGFMVSSSLFMTNNHVIGSKDNASKFELHFNYQYALDGSTIMNFTKYDLDPEGFFYTNPDLDFTIVKVKSRSATSGGTATDVRAGDEFGHVSLVTSFFYSVGQLTNVIQHPQGRPKEIALHENKIDAIYANVVRYTTDTEPGSSGSPVFNNSWKLIALHHSAGEQGPDGKYVDNEGIRIDRIMQDLKKQPVTTIPADILKELGI